MSFKLFLTGLALFDDILDNYLDTYCSFFKKIMKILKDDENNNTVVTNIMEIFVLLVKEYLTVISQ
jgi:hypothetical protein